MDSNNGEPIPGAGVNLKDTGIWTVSDENGVFILSGLGAGDHTLVFACLGYADKSLNFKLSKDIDKLTIKLSLSSLALKSVTVTAEQDKEGLNTNLKFGANALEHLQMSNVTDISALLPGGKTINPDLTTDNSISLRSGGLSA